ncbi:MAG: cytochrome c oxidase assembly protein [Proteobacteria bacterium]|nr:cytochrome c oxidase assembly protein [Pseudomonadota bacterium]
MTTATAGDTAAPSRDWLLYGVLLSLGAALDIVCRYYPAQLPPWMPWEFSWPVFLATTLSLTWFFRGLSALAKAERPAPWRIACFVLGVLSIYFALQSRIDYFAQHLFFAHRAQHFVLHHTGAFMIALGTSGRVIRAGMPAFLRPVIDWRPLRRTVDVMQHPAVAPVMFVGMIYFWLIPQFHTRVMLDANIYDAMNWTMALNGIMFWTLIVDPRPKPPASIGYGWRALLIIAIEPPQMVLGAILSLSRTDYYPVYRICGRILDIPGLSDQHYGGLIIWLPGTFLSLLAIIIVLVNMRLNEERAETLQSSS